MFESNMLENMQQMKQWRNEWRDLVTPQFTAFLDGLSTNNQDTAEEETE